MKKIQQFITLLTNIRCLGVVFIMLSMSVVMVYTADRSAAHGHGHPQHRTFFEPSEIPAGNYRLDASHASIIFRIDHMGLSSFAGRFNILEARLRLDPQDLSKTELQTRIDLRSIDTNSDHLEESVQQRDYFDMPQYPFASFVSTDVEQTGPETAQVTGALTMKGVTRPVTLDVTLSGARVHPFKGVAAVGFFATTTIQRSHWGITGGRPLVGDEVVLEIAAEFQRVD